MKVCRRVAVIAARESDGCLPSPPKQYATGTAWAKCARSGNSSSDNDSGDDDSDMVRWIVVQFGKRQKFQRKPSGFLMKKALVAFMLLVSPASGSTYTILGFPEMMSCGAWTREHRLDSEGAKQLDGWLLGFLSGWALNLATYPRTRYHNPLSGLDGAAEIEWMNNYCVGHPLDGLDDAAVHLESQIIDRQKPN